MDEHTTHIELLLDDAVVSGLRIFHRDMRIGSAAVTFGGIGWVETDEAFRKRGFARRTLEEAQRYCTEMGFDVAVLFGIEDFYERWGYAPAIPGHTVDLQTTDLPESMHGLRAEGATGTHRNAIRDVYSALNRTRSCSAIRSEGVWPYVRPTEHTRGDVGLCGHFATEVLLNDAEDLRGYVSAVVDRDDDCLPVLEYGYTEGSVFAGLAALIGRMARERSRDRVAIEAPPDEPFIEYLRGYGCSVLTTYQRTGSGMLRIISLEPLVTKLCPELTKRLRRSPLADWGGDVVLETDMGNVGLSIRDRQVTVASDRAGLAHTVAIPQNKLVQAITGFRDVATLALDEDVHCPPEALDVVRALFPTGHPYMWWDDRF